MRDRERPTKRAQGAAETRTEATAAQPARPYKVGKGKPPKEAQFKPGHSRPAEHLPEVYRSMLEAEAAAFPAAFFPQKSPEEAAAAMEDPQVFRGLLVHLHSVIFTPSTGSTWKSNLDYNDTGLLDYIFTQYLLLCARYSQIPTLENYCLLTGISYNTLLYWSKGDYRDNTATDKYNIFNSMNDNTYSDNEYNTQCIDDDNIGTQPPQMLPREESQRSKPLSHFSLLKRWKDICRSALADQAGRRNSIGSIFLLKSVYQYRDSAPVQIELSQAAPRESAQAIAAKYADAERPQLPGNGDNLTDN